MSEEQSTETLTLAQREAAMNADELADQLTAVRRDRDGLDALIDRMRPVVIAALRWWDGGDPTVLSDAVEAFRASDPPSTAGVVTGPAGSAHGAPDWRDDS